MINTVSDTVSNENNGVDSGTDHNQILEDLHTLSLFIMGCHVCIHLDITELKQTTNPAKLRHDIKQASQYCHQQLHHWQSLFNRFDVSSELSRINHRSRQAHALASNVQTHPRLWHPISQPLYEVLQQAIHYVPITQGHVTPLLHDALCHAGYDVSFDRLNQTPDELLKTKKQPQKPPQAVTTPSVMYGNRDTKSPINPNDKLYDIKFTSQNETYGVLLPIGMTLDLNGYVKGWCADKLSKALSQGNYGAHGLADNLTPFDCLVDMGGDIAIGIAQIKHTLPAWGIAVTRPNAQDLSLTTINDVNVDVGAENMAILRLYQGAVATSGQDYRRWYHQQNHHHHLIDSATQASADSDVLTATIVDTTALEAEIWAKYAVLVGFDTAKTWLNKTGKAGILISTKQKTFISDGMMAYIHAQVAP